MKQRRDEGLLEQMKVDGPGGVGGLLSRSTGPGALRPILVVKDVWHVKGSETYHAGRLQTEIPVAV